MELKSTLTAIKVGEKTVEEGKVELFNMDINISQEDKERLKNNPQEFMKELMEGNGLKVKSVSGDKDALIKSIEGRLSDEERGHFGWMHFILPEEMNSTWRYVYWIEKD